MHVRSAYCRGDRDAGIYSPHPQAEARISGSRSADMPEPPLASEVLTVDLVLRAGQGIQRGPLTLWGETAARLIHEFKHPYLVN